MSRVIKFRTWNGEQMISPDYIRRGGTGFWTENSIPCYSTDLMQFIGLKDKNGVDIYEGDLIPIKLTFNVDSSKECSYINTDENGNKTYKKIAKVNTVVCFIEGEIHFKYKEQSKSLWIAKVDKEDWEVIGNIHENK
tara:strand:- start:60 stop:470 length:411 start_codon:yes stop_codon:yes gene_type:complete